MIKSPLVSIICTAYNHEAYIKDAIEGFISQQTNFCFEVIISDDASTDKTADIIKQYEATYPELIKCFFYKDNQYSKNIPFFYNDLIPACKGKYIAICEGDDYWIDPYKLQKQVDILDNDNKIGLVHTNYNFFHQKYQAIRYSNVNRNLNKVQTFSNLLQQNTVGTLTVCFRKSLLNLIDFSEILNKGFKMGDYPMWIQMANVSDFYYIDEITCTYRVLERSASNSLVFETQESFIINALEIQLYYIDKYKINDIDIETLKFQKSLELENLAFNRLNYIKACEYVRKNGIRFDVSSLYHYITTRNIIMFHIHKILYKLRSYFLKMYFWVKW